MAVFREGQIENDARKRPSAVDVVTPIYVSRALARVVDNDRSSLPVDGTSSASAV